MTLVDVVDHVYRYMRSIETEHAVLAGGQSIRYGSVKKRKSRSKVTKAKSAVKGSKPTAAGASRAQKPPRKRLRGAAPKSFDVKDGRAPDTLAALDTKEYCCTCMRLVESSIWLGLKASPSPWTQLGTSLSSLLLRMSL